MTDETTAALARALHSAPMHENMLHDELVKHVLPFEHCHHLKDGRQIDTLAAERLAEYLAAEGYVIEKADPDTMRVPRAEWEALQRVARAANSVLPEVMEGELGSIIAPSPEEGIRIVQAKADRWLELRAALAALSSEPEP